MISLAQPMVGMAPMQRRREMPMPQIQQRRPSPLGMAVDAAETKAIDYALGQVGKEGAKKALATAGGAMMGPMGAVGGEIAGELLAPFLKSLFFARGGYIGPLGMETGGEVPKKYKGFSKLPEAVQQKISPDLAKKYDMGGRVSGPPMSSEAMMFSGKGMTPMGIDSEDYFKSLMESGKIPLGSGYSIKPDANKKGGSLTLEYEFSKEPGRNMMTGIKNMFNNFRGR